MSDRMLLEDPRVNDASKQPKPSPLEVFLQRWGCGSQICLLCRECGSAFSIGVTLARKQRTFCKCPELLRECSSSLSGISCCPSLKKQFLCDFLIPFIPQLCLRLCSCFWLNPRSSKASSSSSFFFSSSSCLSSVCRLSSSSSCSPLFFPRLPLIFH